jgi:peptidoglycan/LPS O-acetylase OafA/YrhL
MAVSQWPLSVAGLASPAIEHADYRPDIDGLRAVAVIGVVIYHALPTLLPGGFVGVDIFFVISGYLISGIILRALERGRFSFIDFYIRRVKRIFPALIVMLIAVLVFSWLLLLSDEYRTLGKHIVGGAGFALNLLLYNDFNAYFGVTTTPLLHLWSLGVEEQFYLLWPLLLVALWRWTTRPVRLAMIVAIAVASFACNVAVVTSDPMASFYLPTTRLWELAMGSALACVRTPCRNEISTTTRMAQAGHRLWRDSNLRGALGALLIVVSLTQLNSNLAFPGWWALLPTTGTVLLISCEPQGWIHRYVLSNRLAVFIGLISYPLYLWHWPLLSLGHLVEGRAFTPTSAWTLVGLSVLLATLTYKYVEIPLRSSPQRNMVAGTLCAVMTMCAIAGFFAFAGAMRPYSQRFELERFIRASTEDWLPNTNRDWTWYPGDFVRIGAGSRETLFIGDSNMQQYFPRIEHVMAQHRPPQRAAVFAVRAGCTPIVIELVQSASAAFGCRAFAATAMKYAEQAHVDTVVIAAYWRGYLLSHPADFTAQPLKPGASAKLAQLGHWIAQLVAQGKRVYLVLNIPTSPDFDPRGMIHRSLLPPSYTVDIRSPSRSEVEAAVDAIAQPLRALARSAGAKVIDPLEQLCDPEICPAATSQREPIYRDPRHLRPSYVREHAQFLDPTVLE